VMSFVDQGTLSLDDKVTKFIPLFGKYMKGYITVRDCLDQMTGLESDPSFLKRFSERKQYHSLEEEVNEFATKKTSSPIPD